MPCKQGQLDVDDQFITFSINLNDQHVNGMNPFDSVVHMYVYQIL